MARPTKRKPSKASVAAVWREFFETPEGRIAVNALLTRCGVYTPIMAMDPTSIAVQVGERNIGAWVAEMCGLKAESYVEERSTFNRVQFDDVKVSDYL
jgi:hypothetical protein